MVTMSSTEASAMLMLLSWDWTLKLLRNHPKLSSSWDVTTTSLLKIFLRIPLSFTLDLMVIRVPSMQMSSYPLQLTPKELALMSIRKVECRWV